MNAWKEWLPIFMPIISLFLGLTLTYIFTSIKKSKKDKARDARLIFLEKENNEIKEDYKLFASTVNNKINDFRIDLKNAHDRATVLESELKMYRSGSSVEYNKELEAKANEYFKINDNLSNELLAAKNTVAEQQAINSKLLFENQQLKSINNNLQKEHVEQSNWVDSIKKLQDALNNIKFPQTKQPEPKKEAVSESVLTKDEELPTEVKTSSSSVVSETNSSSLVWER